VLFKFSDVNSPQTKKKIIKVENKINLSNPKIGKSALLFSRHDTDPNCLGDLIM
jgi:hypothetical protein